MTTPRTPVYLVVGTIMVTKKFAKHIAAKSADDARAKIKSLMGSAGDSINIESVFVQLPKRGRHDAKA